MQGKMAGDKIEMIKIVLETIAILSIHFIHKFRKKKKKKNSNFMYISIIWLR
jgi:uncharacterized membrane protein YqhA